VSLVAEMMVDKAYMGNKVNTHKTEVVDGHTEFAQAALQIDRH
jgi:hypothetical protein